MAEDRIRIENTGKRVRTYLGGEPVADTINALLVWEKPYYPVYYFPEADVRTEMLTPTDHTERSPSRGTARFFTVNGANRIAERAAYRYPDSPIESLRDVVAFGWDSMDAWFEEDEEVFVHARDPYTRVDILSGSRHVEVVINGVRVADSHHPRLLFETGLPTRYYLPKTDVRMALLSPSETTTRCPYKGTAEYWTVNAGGEEFPDIVWSYRTPARESTPIAGLVSFYNEKVDLFVDGVLQERPKILFS